jgi:hypothetical protein
MVSKKVTPKKVVSLGDPKATVKRLLAGLSERAREVLIRRYGLVAGKAPETLEAIGSTFGVTRERVRQIEAHALTAVRESAAYEKEQAIFEKMKKHIEGLGAVVSEDELLATFGADDLIRHNWLFLLSVGSFFTLQKEDADFRHRWSVDTRLSSAVHTALKNLYQTLPDDGIVPEADIINQFLDELKDVNETYKTDEVIRRWLSLSKTIACNPLGEWGRTSCPAVRVKGIRDYAYLTLKRHGSPMHFSEVAEAIQKLFTKEAHVATTHNELIKDSRFVLVGRGMYALKEWGYTAGVVRDVIRSVLEKSGPISREELLKEVKKERYVKDNTILVNLNDTRYFKKLSDGRFRLA